VFTSPTFNDKERLAVLLAQSIQGLQDALTYQGHYFAKLQSAAGLSRTQYLKELWSGISQLAFLKQLLKQNDLDHTLSVFKVSYWLRLKSYGATNIGWYLRK